MIEKENNKIVYAKLFDEIVSGNGCRYTRTVDEKGEYLTIYHYGRVIAKETDMGDDVDVFRKGISVLMHLGLNYCKEETAKYDKAHGND